MSFGANSFGANEENESIIPVNPGVMQTIYAITDKLDNIETEIKKNTQETIETITKTCITMFASQKQESTKDNMTAMLMTEVLKNPSSADTLLMLAEKFGYKG